MKPWTLPLQRFLAPEDASRLRRWALGAWDTGRARGRKLLARDGMLTMVLLDTGLRESEVADLHCSDVRIAKGQRHLHVRRGKGGKQRTVVLADETRRLLAEYLEWRQHCGWSSQPDSPLFPSSRGGRLHRSAIWRIWSGALGAAGIQHHRVHDARHFFATALYRATRDLRLVQKQLGHQSVTTTTVYADVLDEDLAAGMDKMLNKEAP